MAQVPIIDLSNFPERKQEVTQQLLSAALDTGFFYLQHHSISLATVDEMFDASSKFFSLSDSVKARYAFEKQRNAGWEKLAQMRPSTGTIDQKESLSISMITTPDKIPTEQACPGFAVSARTFMEQCQSLSLQLLDCFAQGLGFPANYFDPHHDVTRGDCQQTLRCLFYHGKTDADVKAAAGLWRAGAHTDFDTLTLLFQRPGEKGLEMCAGRQACTDFAAGDEWTPVDPIEGAIAVNIGDMLMRWSDDRLKSNYHRVRMPRAGEYLGPRYSLAWFNQANKESIIQGPLKRYPPVSGGQFMLDAMQRNYEALQRLTKEPAVCAA
ncbi:hypothetical protein WJX84_009561 [Apatococcus fuscideae]|uniref:Fe2OG dioxygenase domain-containing protein n=1 Tax=Apatococcus fuscideae TaxID=2026836 RepID=A0AAW1TBR8_9CHLO